MPTPGTLLSWLVLVAMALLLTTMADEALSRKAIDDTKTVVDALVAAPTEPLHPPSIPAVEFPFDTEEPKPDGAGDLEKEGSGPAAPGFVAVLPEPAALAVLAVGLLAVGSRLRKVRRVRSLRA